MVSSLKLLHLICHLIFLGHLSFSLLPLVSVFMIRVFFQCRWFLALMLPLPRLWTWFLTTSSHLQTFRRAGHSTCCSLAFHPAVTPRATARPQGALCPNDKRLPFPKCHNISLFLEQDALHSQIVSTVHVLWAPRPPRAGLWALASQKHSGPQTETKASTGCGSTQVSQEGMCPPAFWEPSPSLSCFWKVGICCL